MANKCTCTQKKVFRKQDGIPFEKVLTYLWNKVLIMFEAYVPGQASGMDENFTTLLALVGDLVVLLLIVPRQVSLGCKHITTILNNSRSIIVKQTWMKTSFAIRACRSKIKIVGE